MNRNMTLTAAALAALVGLTGCSAGSEPAAAPETVTVAPQAPETTEAAPTTEAPAPVETTEAPAPEPTPEETTEAPAPGVENPTVGTPVTVDQGDGNVAKVTIVGAQRLQQVSDEFMHTPATNGEYLLIDVLWETDSGVTAANPYYFSARTADGRTAEQNIFIDQAFTSGDVFPGDLFRGNLAYDVIPGEPVTITITDTLMNTVARVVIPANSL